MSAVTHPGDSNRATAKNEKADRWGIVGGGLLGLTIAHRLAQQGKQVTVLEGAAQLGGLASAWQLGDVVWDRHYHVTLLSDTHLLGLLAELGLAGEIEWTETRTGCYAGGHLYSISNSIEFLTFPPLGLLDKLRLAATIYYNARLQDWKRLEQIPVEEWLRKLSGRRTFERLWLPLLRAKLGENYRETSAAFIWATIQRLYAARRTGLKKEMFGYVRGGYARVLERFAEVLAGEGASVELGCKVDRVLSRPDHGGVEVTMTGGGVATFDQVAITAPAPVAARVCPQLSADERSRLEGIRYQGIVCASLLLERPLADYYLTYITEPDLPFTAVIEMTALVNRDHFGGKSLVYLPKYVPADDPLLRVPDAEVEASFVSGLARMYPGFDRADILGFQVSRVRHVLAISTLGFSDRIPPMVTSVKGVNLVNSAQIVNGTLNVNETVRLAEGAAAVLGGAPGQGS